MLIFFYFLLLLTTVFSYKSLAHDYQTVYSDRVAYYQDENKTVHCIKIDSVKFDGDSILYPMKNLQFLDYYMLCPNPIASSWFTNKIIIRQNENLLINAYNDTSYIRTNSEPGDKWYVSKVYKYFLNYEIYAEHIKSSYENILGVMDSVKYIKLSVIDSTSPSNSHVVNNQILILSKNHGLIQTIGFTYLTNKELGNSNINNPQLNLIGTNSIKNSFQNFNTFDVFDFEIGDEFQIQSTSQTNQFGHTYFIYKYVIDKFKKTDSVFYKIKTITNHFYYEKMKLISSDSNEDTTLLKVGKIKELESLPDQIFFENGGYNAYAYNIQYNENIWQKRRDNNSFTKYNQNDTCWRFSNSFNSSDYYVLGAGGPYGGSFYAPDDNSYYNLVYYKKGNKTWGKPLVLTSIENEFENIQIDVYPNPSSNFLNISLPDLDKQFHITLIDLNSNIVLEQKLTNDQNKLDISSLSNGMYIYRIFMNNSEIKTGKFIKNDLFR